MNNIITFGEHAGKSFEWLFFKAPWYVEWMRWKGIHRQRHNFSEEQEEYFDELYKRATHLAGTCPQCQERPVTYMGLSRLYGSDTLGNISFYCDECDYMGGSPTGYYTPSMFMPYDAPRCEQLRLTTFIKGRYIGPHVRLTQEKMEAFFHNDAHFARATPGFFAREHAGGLT